MHWHLRTLIISLHHNLNLANINYSCYNLLFSLTLFLSGSWCGEDRLGEDPSFSDSGSGAHLQAQVHAAQRNRGHHHLAHQGALHADLWRSQVGRFQERRSVCVIQYNHCYGFESRIPNQVSDSKRYRVIRTVLIIGSHRYFLRKPSGAQFA